MEFNLKDLAQEIPYKWRIQSFSKHSASATCVAYIDARDVMNILDEVIGPENWQSDYKEIKGNLYAGVALRINGEWVWKWDCGTESKTDGEKGEASDAFKRACVKWGIGRFLYEIPIQFVKTNEAKTDINYPYPIDDKGNKIKDLSLHLNKNKKIVHIRRTKDISNILNQIETCTSIDSLREIREKNKELESTDVQYKNALNAKYKELNNILMSQ